MRIAVTGSNGQVGSALLELLEKRGRDEFTGLSKPNGDITNRTAITNFVKEWKPDIILHPAAYTLVDQAEVDPPAAYRVNALGTQNLALACAAADIPLVYVSTNCVFDGNKPDPYFEYDTPNPASVYGRSKLAGEMYVQTLLRKYYVVRTSWVFGPKPGGESNFVTKILKVADERGAASVVDDEISNPTYAPDLAAALLELMKTEAYGLYHLSNENPTSRYDFAAEIFKQTGRNIEVKPMKLADFKRPTPPLYQSALHNFAAAHNLDLRLRPWQEALADYIKLRNL
jgi:dTDP-4-dehydrorhamnose reductase